jgi:hypothetical protein
VKRSGRDEPIWIAIQKCMETPGISLYSYLYLKLAKTLRLSYYLLCFLFNKIREQEAEQVLPRSVCGVGVGGVEQRWRRREEVAQIMYTHKINVKTIK